MTRPALNEGLGLGPRRSDVLRIPEHLRCNNGSYPYQRYLDIMKLMPDLANADETVKDAAILKLCDIRWPVHIGVNAWWQQWKDALWHQERPDASNTLTSIMLQRISKNRIDGFSDTMVLWYTLAGLDILASISKQPPPAGAPDVGTRSGRGSGTVPGTALVPAPKIAPSALAGPSGSKDLNPPTAPESRAAITPRKSATPGPSEPSAPRTDRGTKRSGSELELPDSSRKKGKMQEEAPAAEDVWAVVKALQEEVKLLKDTVEGNTKAAALKESNDIQMAEKQYQERKKDGISGAGSFSSRTKIGDLGNR